MIYDLSCLSSVALIKFPHEQNYNFIQPLIIKFLSPKKIASMKTFKLAGMTLIILLLTQLTIFFESCQKEVSVPREVKAVEIATRTNNANVNALPHTRQYPADVATAWFTLLTNVARTKPYTNPPTLRIFAYSGMALYESVVPGMPSYQSIYKYLTGNTIEFDNKKDYYWPACANAAIARIAFRIMQNYPAPNLTPIQTFESTLNTSFQSQVTPDQLQFSNEFGRYVADIIYDWSRTDGTLNPDGSLAVCPAYVPSGNPGNWVPTPPGFLPPAGVCQGNLRTFIPNIVNTVLAPPPPVYSTDPTSVFYKAANEVYQRRNNISPDEIRLVNNWRDIIGTNYNPLSHTLKITTDIIIKEKLNLEDAAVLFAKQTIAASDAVGAVFNSKFHYALIRPITYIQGVMGYTNWNSTFNTPQHPSYPDELSATASTVTILEDYFGTNYAFVDSTHKALYGEWSYPSLNALLADIVQLRVNSGTSFRFGGETGVIQGRAVGEMVDALPFKKD